MAWCIWPSTTRTRLLVCKSMFSLCLDLFWPAWHSKPESWDWEDSGMITLIALFMFASSVSLWLRYLLKVLKHFLHINPLPTCAFGVSKRCWSSVIPCCWAATCMISFHTGTIWHDEELCKDLLSPADVVSPQPKQRWLSMCPEKICPRARYAGVVCVRVHVYYLLCTYAYALARKHYQEVAGCILFNARLNCQSLHSFCTR